MSKELKKQLERLDAIPDRWRIKEKKISFVHYPVTKKLEEYQYFELDRPYIMISEAELIQKLKSIK